MLVGLYYSQVSYKFFSENTSKLYSANSDAPCRHIREVLQCLGVDGWVERRLVRIHVFEQFGEEVREPALAANPGVVHGARRWMVQEQPATGFACVSDE